MSPKPDFSDVLARLPASPGVYIMRDSRGRAIYVGKAVNLRRRVRQYFAPSSSDTRPSLGEIRSCTRDVEVVVTRSEKEALLLELNFVQRLHPRLNVRLRDDKDFLGLRLDRSVEWPRLELVRRPKSDGAVYFGPFPSASAARETLKVVNRHFKLRSCRDRNFSNRVRPCVQHQIHRCLAPCVLEVSREEYMRQVEYVRLFLEGRRDDLLRELERRMQIEAAEMEYERAAVYRDQISAVERTLAPQRITEVRAVDQDVIGLHREGNLVQLVVLEVRSGRLAGRRDYSFSRQEAPDGDLVASFLLQRYTVGKATIPDEVVVPCSLPASSAVAEILSEQRGRKAVRVIRPRRGPRRDQTRLAELNARQAFEAGFGEQRALEERLAALQRRLRLPDPPRRIECVDIAHLGGRDAVGAIGAVVDGAVARGQGRRYRIRSAAAGDDYAAIAEVLSRRFRRAARDVEKWRAPDLLVVDGGRGQLDRAVAVLEELGFAAQPVVALAKARRDDESAKSDRVFLPGRKNPIPLRSGTSSLFLLAAARDEAHRLANTFQRKTRARRAVRSKLDDVPGVGPGLKKELIAAFGSPRGVRNASPEDLLAVPGVGPAIAARIRGHLAAEGEK
ncbi:MAG: excinuclease ABC subunit UvrC [Polyangia bacterium]